MERLDIERFEEGFFGVFLSVPLEEDRGGFGVAVSQFGLALGFEHFPDF